MTGESSVSHVTKSEGGDNSKSHTNYTVQKIVEMYSDSGFASRVETLFEKTTSRTTKSGGS